MQAVASLKREPLQQTHTSRPWASNTVPTTLYDLLMGLQRLCGPDDDFVLSLVIYWLLSGHLKLSTGDLDEDCCPHGGAVYE